MQTRHARHSEPSANKKRVPQSGEVNDLKMTRIEGSIQWTGKVRLHLLNEDSDSMLAEVEWPAKSGRMFYGCASTGLLFDKQSGRCQQSSNVTLLLDSVHEVECSRATFVKWRAARWAGGCGMRHITIKRGPKPKGYVEPDSYDADI